MKNGLHQHAGYIFQNRRHNDTSEIQCPDVRFKRAQDQVYHNSAGAVQRQQRTIDKTAVDQFFLPDRYIGTLPDPSAEAVQPKPCQNVVQIHTQNLRLPHKLSSPFFFSGAKNRMIRKIPQATGFLSVQETRLSAAF